MKTTEELNSDLWRNLTKIQFVLGLADSEMAELLLIRRKDYQSSKLNQKPISIRSGMAFAEQVYVGFERLITGEIDYRAMLKQFQGNDVYLPEKYTVGAQSRRSTVINILNWISDNMDWERRAQILRYFQVKEAVFDSPDKLINLKLSVDIGRYVLKYSQNPQFLIEMGRYASATHRASAMGQELGKSKNMHQLFERMFEEIIPKYIEQNFQWKIVELTKDGITVDGFPNQDICELVGEDYVKCYTGTLIRQGVLSSVPCYIGEKSVQVKRLKCVSQGDPQIRFSARFSELKNKKRSHLQVAPQSLYLN